MSLITTRIVVLTSDRSNLCIIYSGERRKTHRNDYTMTFHNMSQIPEGEEYCRPPVDSADAYAFVPHSVSVCLACLGHCGSFRSRGIPGVVAHSPHITTQGRILPRSSMYGGTHHKRYYYDKIRSGPMPPWYRQPYSWTKIAYIFLRYVTMAQIGYAPANCDH